MVDWIGVLIGVFALIVSGIAIWRSHKASKKEQSVDTYSDLDSLYLEVLKIGMENPKFRNKKMTSKYKTAFKGDDRLKYEVYAYIVWNACETVYDRTKGDDENWKTWEPIIVEENDLHRQWFDDNTTKADDEHPAKFKQKFVDDIKESFDPPSS